MIFLFNFFAKCESKYYQFTFLLLLFPSLSLTSYWYFTSDSKSVMRNVRKSSHCFLLCFFNFSDHCRKAIISVNQQHILISYGLKNVSDMYFNMLFQKRSSDYTHPMVFTVMLIFFTGNYEWCFVLIVSYFCHFLQ